MRTTRAQRLRAHVPSPTGLAAEAAGDATGVGWAEALSQGTLAAMGLAVWAFDRQQELDEPIDPLANAPGEW